MKCEICGVELIRRNIFKGLDICQACYNYHKKYGIFVHRTYYNTRKRISRDQYLELHRIQSKRKWNSAKEKRDLLNSMSPEAVLLYVREQKGEQ